MIIKHQNKFLRTKFTTALLCLFAIAYTQQDEIYRGVVGKTLAESKEYFIPPVTASKDAPNVIWILLDDVDFGASSAFGGLINTPTKKRNTYATAFIPTTIFI